MIERWRLAARWRMLRSVLGDAWPALIVPLGIVVAAAIGYGCCRRNVSTAVAVTGMLLQWFGLAMVASGLMSLRRRFKHPNWLRRLWTALQGPRDITGGLRSGVLGVTGLGAMGVVSGPVNPTIEQRVAQLEGTVRQLQTDLNDQTATIRASVEAVKHDVQREAEKRETEDRSVLRQLEDVSAGGLSLEWIGLWWLFFGVLFTSVPTQLAAYLQRSLLTP